MAKLYTISGDDGTTGIWGGERLAKCDPLVEAIGAIDECNCYLGIIRSDIVDSKVGAALLQIQNDLLVAGCDVSNLKKDPKLPRISTTHMERLEVLLNDFEAEVSPLRNFILPAGSKSSSMLQYARTLARKADRRLSLLSESRAANPALVAYLNRLSDLLFVLARYMAKQDGATEEIWRNPVDGGSA